MVEKIVPAYGKRTESFVTQRGHDKEPIVRTEFGPIPNVIFEASRYITMMQTLFPEDGLSVHEETFCRHPVYKFLGGSPDGIVSKHGRQVLLIFCPCLLERFACSRSRLRSRICTDAFRRSTFRNAKSFHHDLSFMNVVGACRNFES